MSRKDGVVTRALWPWRKDFSRIEPVARRAARYALQIVGRCSAVHPRLQDDDFLGALWGLTLPLIDPIKLAHLQADWHRPDSESDLDLYEDAGLHFRRRVRHAPLDKPLLDGVPGARMRDFLIARFTALPDALLAQVAQADGNAPTHPSVAVLAQCAGLDEIECRILDFVEKKDAVLQFRTFLREAGRDTVRDNYACLAAALDVHPSELQTRMQRRNPLATLRLVKKGNRRADLEDFLQSEDLLEDILTLEPDTPEALLAAVIEPAATSHCTLADFPHLAREAARACAVLGKAAATQTTGVNALLYGPPGSGKTEFASAVAAASGLQAYQVKTADEDGDGLSRAGRLGAYQLTQRLLRGRTDCAVIFDEVEDAFGNAENALLALFGGKPSAGKEKGWMNRTLEENPLPAIWITNDAVSMDPAFLRRFLLPVAFTVPPRRVRRQIAEHHLGDTAVAPAVLDELAVDTALMPAHFSAARRLLDLCDSDAPEAVVREGVAAARRVLHGAAGPRLRRPAMAFDVAFLNLAGGVSPAQLWQALAREGHGSLCFFGPSGTGKTEFAHVLADVLDRELVVKASSDLVAPYVGETERNIVRLFAEIDAAHSVLLLDEVDSLLRDRSQARQSWEATQVNELLQQMERFDGIFIAATNLIGQLDPAAMRRFDFKLQFRPLDRTQRRMLFAREALGDAARMHEIPSVLAARLDGLERLTSGDFANVVRQRELLGETLSAEDFLRRLVIECRYKEGLQAMA